MEKKIIKSEYFDELMSSYDDFTKEKFDIKYNKLLNKAKEKYGEDLISCSVGLYGDSDYYSNNVRYNLYFKVRRYETEDEYNKRISQLETNRYNLEQKEKELYEKLKKKFE